MLIYKKMLQIKLKYKNVLCNKKYIMLKTCDENAEKRSNGIKYYACVWK